MGIGRGLYPIEYVEGCRVEPCMTEGLRGKPAMTQGGCNDGEMLNQVQHDGQVRHDGQARDAGRYYHFKVRIFANFPF